MTYHLAVDLGASGGRCILGWLEDGEIRLEEVHRFKNEPAVRDGHLCWDTDSLFRQILIGMRRCGELKKKPISVGVDTWGVDFALLDSLGNRLGNIVAYRDSRTDGIARRLGTLLDNDALYRRTGIQAQNYNTLYQLVALKEQSPKLLARAERLLLMPDYFHYLLSGAAANEYTVASTTGLVNAVEQVWDLDLVRKLGLPEKLFSHTLTPPSMPLAPLSAAVAEAVGYECTVVLPVSHDTGSAFLAVPAGEVPSVYISSGTWSLLGVENATPITTEESRLAGFTNEGGYGGTYRYLKNIMGLWILQRLRAESGDDMTFPLLARLAEESACASIVDVDDPRFFAPANMTDALCRVCRETGQELPRTLGDAARCVYRSLAKRYGTAIKGLERLTGQCYAAIHIVGGGSQDSYLNRLTAAETGLTVYAGPTEGSALGNLMAQMLATKEFKSILQAREAVRRGFPIYAYPPETIV